MGVGARIGICALERDSPVGSLTGVGSANHALLRRQSRMNLSLSCFLFAEHLDLFNCSVKGNYRPPTPARAAFPQVRICFAEDPFGGFVQGL